MSARPSTRRSDLLRWAVPEDATALADVHVTTWQYAYEGIFADRFLNGLDRERRGNWWKTFIEEGARVHVVDDHGIVGFCHAGASDAEGWGEIFAIYVHPDHWGRGHGDELLRAGEATLRDAGFGRSLLWVLEDNSRARGFYEGQGWSLGKAIRIEDIGGVQVTELRYEKDL
jgi:ribosomal protein S18 acetylase RimI-like enzyme